MSGSRKLLSLVERGDLDFSPSGAGYDAKLELEDVAHQAGLRLNSYIIYNSKYGVTASFVGRPGQIEYDFKEDKFYISIPYYWGRGWSKHAPYFGTDNNPGGSKEAAIDYLKKLKSGSL